MRDYHINKIKLDSLHRSEAIYTAHRKAAPEFTPQHNT